MFSAESFFREYAAASTTGKPETIARFYAKSFIAATKTESKYFENDEKFLEWLKGIGEFNKKTGLDKMEVVEVKGSVVGKGFMQATVTWQAFYESSQAKVLSLIHTIYSISAT